MLNWVRYHWCVIFMQWYQHLATCIYIYGILGSWWSNVIFSQQTAVTVTFLLQWIIWMWICCYPRDSAQTCPSQPHRSLRLGGRSHDISWYIWSSQNACLNIKYNAGLGTWWTHGLSDFVTKILSFSLRDAFSGLKISLCNQIKVLVLIAGISQGWSRRFFFYRTPPGVSRHAFWSLKLIEAITQPWSHPTAM